MEIREVKKSFIIGVRRQDRTFRREVESSEEE